MKDSGIIQLLDSYEDDQLASHTSSNDPNGTKNAAYRFFNPILNNTKKYYDDNDIKSLNKTEEKLYNISYHYMRAVCRIYLPDYTCLNYQLPKICQNILDDVQNSIDKYNKIQIDMKMKISFRKYFKKIFSEYILEVIALSSCYLSLSSTTECFYKTLAWLKGIEYVNDDDDE